MNWTSDTCLQQITSNVEHVSTNKRMNMQRWKAFRSSWLNLNPCNNVQQLMNVC